MPRGGNPLESGGAAIRPSWHASECHVLGRWERRSGNAIALPHGDRLNLTRRATMISSWNRIPALAGLGLAATLVLGVAGCGGKETESGDAVVVTEPNANVPTVGTTAPAPAGGSGT